jgi:hypothetical protein
VIPSAPRLVGSHTDSECVFARRSLMAWFLAGAASFVSASDQLGNEPTGTVHGHPALTQCPRPATTSSGRQGDAVNTRAVAVRGP